MARTLTIKNEHIETVIAPDNGGMLISLKVDGIETIYTDISVLQSDPMKAGGCPVMFPFPSKTSDDSYIVNNQSYGMPFHGLLKNNAFGIKKHTDDEIVLFMTNNEAWLSSQYPFPFELELRYVLLSDGIRLVSTVKNNGSETLYHAFGWHPFFYATDKKSTELYQNYKIWYDHKKDCDLINDVLFDDLSKYYDQVLHTPEKNGFSFVNHGDGYQVNAEIDDHFQVLVVYTGNENTVCIEPWCGIPNTANTKRFAQYVEPGKSEDYTFSMHLKTI